VAGIRRNAKAEEEAFAAAPLPEFGKVHGPAIHWAHQRMWRSWLAAAPRLMRAFYKVNSEPTTPTGARDSTATGEALLEDLKALAMEVGISAVGIAKYDQKYTWEPYLGGECGDRVVVCILEQPYEATQTIPSYVAERAALGTYSELMTRALELGRILRAAGYMANVNDIRGHGAAIHYAVEAGMGQLGLNGQLLTPFAGSRCRILMINTDAPLPLDHPVDFGIEKLCDACQACVERCPAGAIPGQRKEHRGIVKAKLNTERCLPVVAQVDGCAICMKVCPVQKYGLPAVHEHFESTGQVLGRGTDQLEGYDWPLDGQHYGPGNRPKLGREFFDEMGDRLVVRKAVAEGDDVAFL
jgi:ferredoxin